MVNRELIATLDVEGDGLDREINQKLFPAGAHIDPNTRVWCATFTIRRHHIVKTVTFVTKLNGTRPVTINGRLVGMTVAEHYDSSIIPESVDTIYGHHDIIKVCKDESEVLDNIANTIWELIQTGYNIYCKGYNAKYNYDALVLYNASIRHGNLLAFKETCWSCLRNACCSCCQINKLWNKTHEQIKKGDYKSNQEYLIDGIKHNIEDSYQLFSIWDKHVVIQNRKEALRNDFSTSSK